MDTNWNFQGFNGQNPFHREEKPRRERRPIGTPLSRTLINLAVTVLFGAVYFYVTLPALNLKNESFYGFLILLCLVYIVCAILTSGFQGTGAKGYFGFVKKQCKIPGIVIAAAVLAMVLGSVVGWTIFRSGAYRDLLTVTTGDFAAEVEEIGYDQIPMLDRDSATKLGNRKLI